ncbi:hypothetical protein ACMGDK_04840 [Chryseobacterium sp. DT-3]|uniref:hypothetical protein n=1 Tax=Chryseobacterium sp. DT-3 TaxID=3396164 RepID=UPI003F1CC43D
MEDSIYYKIQEYDPKMKSFEISYTDRPLPIKDLISLYTLRNKIAQDENVKRLTKQILDDFCLIEQQSHEHIKFVIARYNGISRMFFFSEDKSQIFSDFIFQ